MKRVVFLLAAVVLVGQAQLVLADMIVAPGANATNEGNSLNYYPFAINIDDPEDPLFNANPLKSQRYQQVYASSLFGGYTTPLSIERISFRPNSDYNYGGAFSATLSDIQINLSTTPWTMDELTSEFAHNVGADDTPVVDRGPLTLSSSFTGPTGGPKDFDIHIDLDTPFVYDPTLGNLVMDVRNYGGVDGNPLTMIFDAEVGNLEIYRIYTRYWVGGTLDGVNLDTAQDAPGAMGLVTQFTFTPTDDDVVPIPLPGAALLGVVGLGCAGWRLRRRTA
jgi:hypothetical protein